ncbi:hypothetical protein BDF14DRAFT_1740939 [Spinellus fusiger]|nr:hypothetical protein BDF14DRAFT_1740939 [Spinellus fusiger]
MNNFFSLSFSAACSMDVFCEVTPSVAFDNMVMMFKNMSLDSTEPIDVDMDVDMAMAEEQLMESCSAGTEGMDLDMPYEVLTYAPVLPLAPFRDSPGSTGGLYGFESRESLGPVPHWDTFSSEEVESVEMVSEVSHDDALGDTQSEGSRSDEDDGQSSIISNNELLELLHDYIGVEEPSGVDSDDLSGVDLEGVLNSPLESDSEDFAGAEGRSLRSDDLVGDDLEDTSD